MFVQKLREIEKSKQKYKPYENRKENMLSSIGEIVKITRKKEISERDF